MGLSRNLHPKKIFGGKAYGTSMLSSKIRSRIESGKMAYSVYITKEADRLDTIAGIAYGDSSYWWAIAAASGIGWALQVPPGIVLKIPEVAEIMAIVTSKV